MFTSQGSAEYKQSKWKSSISKIKNNNVHQPLISNQPICKFTPKSSRSDSQQKNFISKVIQKKSQLKLQTQKSQLKEEIENIPTLKFRKQYQQDRVNECNSCRLQKKTHRAAFASELHQSQRETVLNTDVSRIALQTNKSLNASSQSKRNYYQFFNLQEKQVIISRNFADFRALFLSFRRYLQQQLQTMQIQFYRAIHAIKKEYEHEINQLKNQLESLKRETQDEKNSVFKKQLRFQDARLNSKIGTIVKCKNKSISVSESKQNRLAYSAPRKTLQQQEEDKLKRQKSFDKIFQTIQILKQSVDHKNHNITSEVSNQISLVESTVRDNQWGLYSFKMNGGGLPLTVHQPVKSQNNQNNRKLINLLKIHNSQVRQQECVGIISHATQISNWSQKMKNEGNSPELYGSVTTACFDLFDRDMKQNRI